MPEERAIPTNADVKRKMFSALVVTGIVVTVTLAVLLGVMWDNRETVQEGDLHITMGPRQSATSSAANGASSRQLGNLPERLAVLESRKAMGLARIESSSETLQRLRQLLGDRADLLESLQTSEAGRKIAANEDLIEMYLALSHAELPTGADLHSLELTLAGLSAKLKMLRSGLDLGRATQLVADIVPHEERLRKFYLQLVQAQHDIEALLLLAVSERASPRTLANAAEQYQLQLRADHQLKMTQALRSARASQQADEERQATELSEEISELRSELTDSQRQIELARQRAQQEFARRDAARSRLEVEFQRDLPDIRSLLKPFITPGYNQHTEKFMYKADENPNPRPVSLGSLVSIGYLHHSTERLTAFWRSTGHNNDRPLGSFPRAQYGQTRLPVNLKPVVERAQGYLRKYGELMVELGFLDP